MPAPMRFMARADLFLLDAASTVGNPTPVGSRIAATKVKIPLQLQSEEMQFLGTGGTYTQMMGPQQVTLEFSLGGWSADFIDAVLVRDIDNIVYAKVVSLLLQGKLQTQNSNVTDDAVFVCTGQFMEGDLFTLDAGKIQETDFKFVLSALSVKVANRTVLYNFAGF